MAEIGAATDIEREFVEMRASLNQRLHGLPPLAAQRFAIVEVAHAAKRSREAGTYGLPLDLGERFLEGRAPAPLTSERLAHIRAEGATDDDIRGWWNQHDLSRRLQVGDHEGYGEEIVKGLRGSGMTEAAARTLLLRSRPRYSSPETHAPNYRIDIPPDLDFRDHRGLPLELKNRIDRWLVGVFQAEGASCKAAIDLFGSVNAIIRSAMRSGELARI